MTREMSTYSRSTDSLPDFVVENQLNTFVYLKFLICPPCCHDDAKLEKIRHITKLHLIKRLLQVTKLDILIHSAFHQWRIHRLRRRRPLPRNFHGRLALENPLRHRPRARHHHRHPDGANEYRRARLLPAAPIRDADQTLGACRGEWPDAGRFPI